MAFFRTLRDLVRQKFTKNYSKESRLSEYSISFSLNKEGNLDLDCIMPELTSKDTDLIAEKFSFLLSYIIGPSVLNDIILTFGDNVEQESEEYQIFIKKVLAKIVSAYKNNPYLKDSQEYNSNSQNRPLIKPSNAMKSIVMSETFNIK